MSYGYTPYDKNSYRNGKKRRKRSLQSRRRFLIILFSALAAIIIIAGIFFVTSINSNDDISPDEVVLQNNEQLLTVVNAQNTLDSDYVPELADCGVFKVSILACDMLSDILKKADEQGIDLKIKSAYISFEEQKALYEQTLQRYLANPDYTSVRAEAAAQKETAQAGFSEAQTGLLIEFDISNQKSRAFLERECVNYGFILRYPSEKESLTRTKPSDTLYRYVGKDNAVKMRTYNMCLEQYNDYLLEQKTQN